MTATQRTILIASLCTLTSPLFKPLIIDFCSRHGWTRSFSIPAEELDHLDYETLENILEVHTLKLRPVSLTYSAVDRVLISRSA